VKKLFKHKVFSGALQFTIFIGVIIALILAGLVMLQNTHNFFIQQSKATIENIQLANSGISFLKQQDYLITDTTAIEKLSDMNQKVEVQSSQWGIYEKAIVKTTHRKKIFYKSALLGTQIDDVKRPNLFLQDNFKPLVVVGNTLLKGNIFLPGQGIKSGYIAGESFYGLELLSGNSYKSDTKLPELKIWFKKGIENLSNQEFSPKNYVGGNEMIKCKNSFIKPTKMWYSKAEILLNNTDLTGNIIVKSDSKITINNTATLKDIILIAPIIIIQDGVSGNFQAIASKQLKVGRDCKLSYPSALVFMQEKNESRDFQKFGVPIFIDINTEIRGSVLYLKSTQELDFKTQICLDEATIVKGEVYCEGNFELKGKVVGSVYAQQFIVNKAGTVFINHIYNGQIVNDNFPEAFCGLLFKDNRKGVAKWMY
jgi:cytoskeletal protein CcmA (bactofilin family)